MDKFEEILYNGKLIVFILENLSEKLSNFTTTLHIKIVSLENLVYK